MKYRDEEEIDQCLQGTLDWYVARANAARTYDIISKWREGERGVGIIIWDSMEENQMFRFPSSQFTHEHHKMAIPHRQPSLHIK